jgi:predicted double-glycine peptidase
VALAVALLTPGGTALASDAKAVRSLLEMRDAQVVRQHWDLSCGAAAIATVLTYQLGRPISEREAALGMLRQGDAQLIRARLGFSLLDLKRLAVGYGLQAVGYGGLSLDDLVGLAPVIAPIRVYGFGHFVVVRGRRGDRLLVADPAFGNRTMTLQEFGRAWTSGVGFVIVRPDEPKPPNRMGAPADLFLTPSGTALRSAEAGLRNLGGRQ